MTTPTKTPFRASTAILGGMLHVLWQPRLTPNVGAVLIDNLPFKLILYIMAEENFHKYLKDIRKHLDLGDASEGTHRPALQTLIESLLPKIIATNEPSHTKVGAPDFNVWRDNLLIGHIECKDVDVDLKAVLKTEQLRRYLANLPNLILTDYIDFIWFREGKQIDKAHIARSDSKGKLKLDSEELPRLERLLINFLKVEPAEIGDSRKLAEEMARPARMIRDTIREIFALEEAEGPLHGQLAAFRDVLLPDLEPHDFADMYAQTIAYGLFAARTELDLKAEEFTWQNALYHLPKSNPFLRSLFSKMVGPDNEEPRIKPWMEELALILARSDMFHILADFGKKTKQEDPVVHFYETFIGAYDPKMKKSRGIYYTPEPVVSYIVRSIDYLLRERFGRKKGLADPNVYILDPACGTGSFLLEVLKLIRERIPDAGWPDYVRRYLLPRLFGFELLVAPYTISHLKLGLYLKETGFEFGRSFNPLTGKEEEERLGIYLTNTLEPEVHGQLGFARIIAEEGKRAQKVKKDEPIMVVLGNPPYSGHSANKVKWIGDLVRDYYFVDGKPLGERNPKWLQDDYVKFLRFAQWRIEQTGHGIVGMITNHGYLDNPTFRGMRQQLMKSFSEIYVFDLHGNAKKKEVCPDGSKDENVFDIQQGVAIGVFVKTPSPLTPLPKGEENRSLAHRERVGVRVNHSELWGLREAKYARLVEEDVESIKKEKLKPSSEFYFFIPRNIKLLAEYEIGWKITDIFPVNNTGFITSRDRFVIGFTDEEILTRLKDFSTITVDEARSKYGLRDVRETSLEKSHSMVKEIENLTSKVTTCLYRPFDPRPIFYHHSLVRWPVYDVMSHMLAGRNLGIITTRQTKDKWGALVTRYICPHKSCAVYDINSLFPLYLYPTPKQTGQQGLHTEEIETRKPNLAPEFIAELEEKVKLSFIEDGQGDLKKTFGPEDVFYYIYAVLHSPTYRSRYAEFLKIDFPRVPITSSRPLFRKLVTKGKALTELHLMESEKLQDPAASGVDLNAHPELKNEVVKISYDERHKRVNINKGQYFSGVEPRVWNFHVGGYQVCRKWLKDRKGRRLNYDDITYYQKIVIALRETIKLMESIDKAIPEWPIA